MTIRDLFDHVLSTPVSRQPLGIAWRPRIHSPGPGAGDGSRKFRPRTILLAEDNRTNRLVAESLLAKLGYRCVTAMDGLEAVERVRAGGIDCVLMDLMMPELDGFGATRAIRALPAPLCDTPIVALTANVLTADWAVVRAAGMNDFATKPITRDKLGQVLAKALAGNPPAPEVGEPVSGPSNYPAFDKDALAAILRGARSRQPCPDLRRVSPGYRKPHRSHLGLRFGPWLGCAGGSRAQVGGGDLRVHAPRASRGPDRSPGCPAHERRPAGSRPRHADRLRPGPDKPLAGSTRVTRLARRR